MIGQLTSLALMVAAVLLVLSLPLGDGDAGKVLRRAAAFAFVMAFVPSIVVCVFAPIAKNMKPPAGNVQSFLTICGALAIFGLFAFAAYGFLDMRSRMRSRQPRPHAEHGRYAKRRPSEHGEHHEDSGE